MTIMRVMLSEMGDEMAEMVIRGQLYHKYKSIARWINSLTGCRERKKRKYQGQPWDFNLSMDVVGRM